MNFGEIGRFLLIAGIAITIIGVIFLFSDKIPIGRLPGDIHFSQGNFRIHFPIVTSILLSIVLTIIVNFFSR